ncbi:hypothetical protein BH10ACT4_BH10ACT4_12700 [soil metagenome]|uniref:recombinase family protein n=1 Tax=Glaciihabitans sp. INWT7 TaxID=2596912 RepID=UPI001628D671|nr:recombinase family protein [Glaciihabitans sp. INWT7]QNE46310.1 hypothetical protein F1C58_04895 [Glaciihabitans sp. INWT7]
MKRVAIYTRISRTPKESGDLEGDRLGVKRQETECREYAQKHALLVVDVMEDNDVSASTGRRRDSWESLLKLAQSGEIDGIVAWHPDRLYRRLADLAVLMKVVKDRNLKIYTVKAGEIDLSTPSGILMAEIMGAVAGHEVRHKAERQVSKAREMAHAGLWSGNRVPFGYRLDPTDKHNLVVHSGEADILRQARRRILAGHGLKDTTRWAKGALRDIGEPRETLTASTLRNVLMSPTIAGYRVYVPQSERDEWDQRRREKKSRFDDFQYRPGHLFEAKWDPIFSPEESRSMVSLFSNPERKNPGRAPKSMLSGLLYCQLCGSVLTYSRPKALGPVQEENTGPKPKYVGQTPSYKCSNNSLVCPGLGISAIQIEDYVVEIFRGVFSESPGFKIGTPKLNSLPDQDSRDRLVSLENKWLDLYGDNLMSRAELEKRVREVRQRIGQLDKLEARQSEETARDAAVNDSLTRWDWLTEKTGDQYHADRIAELRSIFKARIRRITILPTRRLWGRNFQELRVVPWYAGGEEPSIDEALAALHVAERDQLERVNARKAAEEARRQLRARRGGLK